MTNNSISRTISNCYKKKQSKSKENLKEKISIDLKLVADLKIFSKKFRKFVYR